jgi:2,3-bisphosphoglycerate-dependent phosphoglycerate mutase
VSGRLILLRHGTSESNEQGVFTGWLDVPLAASGRAQARRAATLLAEHGLLPATVHTSVLARAVDTAEEVLRALGVSAPVARTWRLNERHYGALTGRVKRDVVAEYGETQFAEWRRAYKGTPPPLPDDSPLSPVGDPRYAALGARLPRTESLADVQARLLPYWHDVVRPALADRTVLVTSHSNALRALVKHLERIPDDAIDTLNIPTGSPLVYPADDQGTVTGPGTYLDPHAAEAAAAVAAEGHVTR